ncbi:hypothetical protein U6U86_12335, partial [Cutibacterium acnes]
MPKTQTVCTGAESNLRDRVLVKIEKNNFIALPGKGGHSRLMPSKLCFPAKQWEVLESRGLVAGID